MHIPEGAEIDLVAETSSRPLGKREFQLRVRNGNVNRTFTATAQVHAFNTVYYLSRSVNRGERVKAADLVTSEMDVTRIPKDAIRETSELDAVVASRPLAPNSLLCQSQFRKAPVARRGDRVMLMAGAGSIKAVVPGVLREDGHLGGFVRVTNMMSGKEVSGWLVEPGTVKVEF